MHWGRQEGPGEPVARPPVIATGVSRDLKLQVGRGGCVGSDMDSRVCTARCGSAELRAAADH